MSVEKKKTKNTEEMSGCGFFGLFRRRSRSRAHRRCSSTSSVPTPAPERYPARRCIGSDDFGAVMIQPAGVRVVAKSALAPVPVSKPVPASKPVPGNGLSGELDSILFDYQKNKGKGNLIRATSGNVLLHGNLGNLAQNRSSDKDLKPDNAVVLCRALSKREDPEALKEQGNEEFRKGRYAKALVLYDKAIALDSNKAAYRSNKAAALSCLGRMLEAVVECREALRLDPNYCRAHYRLAGLYLRLGEAESAVHHYKQSQHEANPNDILQAEVLQSHLAKCSEACSLKNWQAMLTESKAAFSLGSDLSPQVFAWRAEALMKLHKHNEAEEVLKGAPKYDIDVSTKFFGATTNIYVLKIQAQVDMASGRFDEGVIAAQKALQLNPNNREISAFARRTRAVASARSKGNNLFNSSRFQEASIAYSEGLDNDPENAILLCNRAACRAKLGHWEKAIDDCNNALMFRPLYAKARLRRAQCNAELKRWQASIQDYEILSRELPGDEEVQRALAEAKSQLQKRKEEIIRDAAHS